MYSSLPCCSGDHQGDFGEGRGYYGEGAIRGPHLGVPAQQPRKGSSPGTSHSLTVNGDMGLRTKSNPDVNRRNGMTAGPHASSPIAVGYSSPSGNLQVKLMPGLKMGYEFEIFKKYLFHRIKCSSK